MQTPSLKRQDPTLRAKVTHLFGRCFCAVPASYSHGSQREFVPGFGNTPLRALRDFVLSNR